MKSVGTYMSMYCLELMAFDMYLSILVYRPGQVCCRRWSASVWARVFGVHGEERGGQADAGVEW